MPSNAKRKRKNIIQLVSVIVVLVVGVFAVSRIQAYSERSELFKVRFSTPNGDTAPFYLEVANNDAERNRGLMFRKEGDLKESEGMLFVFPRDAVQSFWMKNTYLSLDMLFVDVNRKVVGILHDVPVLNKKPRSVGKPSRYVVELLAGTAKKNGITEGSEMKIFKDIPEAK